MSPEEWTDLCSDLCSALDLVNKNAEVTMAIAKVLPVRVMSAFTSRLPSERVFEIVEYYRATGDCSRYKESVLGIRCDDIKRLKEITLGFAQVASGPVDWVHLMRLEIDLKRDCATEVFEMVAYTLLQNSDPKLCYWAMVWLAWLLRAVCVETFERRRLELESLCYTEPSPLSLLPLTTFIVSEMHAVEMGFRCDV